MATGANHGGRAASQRAAEKLLVVLPGEVQVLERQTSSRHEHLFNSFRDYTSYG